MGNKKNFYINGSLKANDVSVKPETRIIAAGGSQVIIVGQVSKHNAIRMHYEINRAGEYETGDLKVTNAADTELSRKSQFNDIGVIISKSIDADDIKITFLDLISAGDVDMTLDIIQELIN